MPLSQEQRNKLRLFRSDNVGPATYRQLLHKFGSATEALSALPDMARNVGRRKIRLYSESQTDREIDQTLVAGAAYCFLGDKNYPVPLANLPDAPPVLVTLGDQTLLQEPSLGIVGARNASAAGKKFTRALAAELGEAEIIITSGLARGIDTAAHEGSLSHGTIAVVAGGIDIIYTPENEALYHQITEQGLVVTELPIGVKPQTRHFPQRNRIISGLSQGVLVVEAALRSGSLITARNAAEQGREVFSVPGSPLDPRHRGTNDLIRQGATLVESAKDVLEVIQGNLFQQNSAPQLDLDLSNSAGETPPPKGEELAEARQRLVSLMGPTPTEVDDLIRETGLTAALVLTILLELEIAGRLERHVGNRVALV